jgi:RHS repeat-associated protein
MVTDGGGGTASYTYLMNDVLQATGPTQIFQKQLEYDGLGRLTSVCEITSATGSGTCGQSNPATGFLTKYTYDSLGNLLTVTQNAQPGAIGGTQTRTYAYDGLSRLTSETNPETGNSAPGTANYVYDVACGTYAASSGDLTKRVDNAGNAACYGYDGLHRLTDAGNGGTACRHLRYDANATPPAGVTVSNTLARLAEAYTDQCSGSKITDEWFSYDPDGRTTDVYELTPHSGATYYHTSSCYWPNGALETLSGVPSMPAIYFGGSNCTNSGTGLDGEGRITKVNAATGINPVTAVTYSPITTTTALAGSITGVTLGSSDSDSYTYYPTTGNLRTYTFSVNSVTDTGTLTWNANGTLGALGIVDHLSGSTDSETCNYFYDDLGRLGGKNSNGYSVDCGSKWQQLFTFDPFGNIQKSGSSSFLATYSPATNHYTLSGVNVQYDNNGNLKTDNLNTYTWDPTFGYPASINSSITLIYDALGRMVEQQGSANTEIVYSPAGKTALMNGQTLLKAFIKLPGGGTAIYNPSGLAYYRHSDWLGSSRLTSTSVTPTTPYSISAYAPYGEQYAISGSSDPSFTGHNPDTVSSLYDFQYREASPSQGRWISPDPAGVSSADPSDPQSWNRYAYVLNNPLRAVDPLGLWCVWDDNSHDDGVAPETFGERQDRVWKTNCEQLGGHWDPYDTITGITTNDEGDVTSITYKVKGGTLTYNNPNGMTLEGFDATLDSYQQLPGAYPPGFMGIPVDNGSPGALVSAWFDNTRLGRWLDLMNSKSLADPSNLIGCILAPDATNDINDLNATMKGDRKSPADEGHPEGGVPVWIPNTNSTKNGGGATQKTPWGEVTKTSGNSSMGEGQGVPGGVALVVSTAAATAQCLQNQ